jgi:hypothetical protein
MDRTLNIQCGINPDPIPNGTVFISNDSIGNTSDWAGSFHIFSMERHHRSYTSGRLPRLPSPRDFPDFGSYRNLSNKNPSQQVIGNFGECVAAIFARRKLGASINDVIPLTTHRAIKRPDYLMKFEGVNVRNLFDSVIPHGIPFPHMDYLNWWPVESKAVAGRNDFGQKRRGLIQLLSFWNSEGDNVKLSVGYGMIVTYHYKNPIQVTVSLILPREQSELFDYLNGPTREEDGSDEYYRTAAGYLYACNI